VSLTSIARAHRFSDQSTMNRLFLRFVGISAGRYRSLVSLLRPRCRSKMADIA
jgi:AraC-like DNA-binding protein